VFDSDAVTNQPKLVLFRVPQSNSKHAAKLVNAVDTPFLECVQDDFSVRMIRLPVVSASSLQFRTNVGVVVNLAVENHPHCMVLIRHRLCGFFR
jgi:hypothetical protein